MLVQDESDHSPCLSPLKPFCVIDATDPTPLSLLLSSIAIHSSSAFYYYSSLSLNGVPSLFKKHYYFIFLVNIPSNLSQSLLFVLHPPSFLFSLLFFFSFKKTSLEEGCIRRLYDWPVARLNNKLFIPSPPLLESPAPCLCSYSRSLHIPSTHSSCL
jgi:hypothetical protein